MMYNQATEWTPERIQEDPVGYLTWTLSEATKADQDFRARWLSLSAKKSATERAMKEHGNEKARNEKLLGDLKDAYRSTRASNTWPVTVRDVSFDELALKRKIVECNESIKNESAMEEAATSTAKTIDNQLSMVQSELGEVLKLKSDLSTALEIAKVKKLVEGIDSIRDRLKSIHDMSIALHTSPDGGPSVAEMSKPSAEERINDEFSKVMGDSTGGAHKHE
jgi:hypothetical protein